MLSLRQSLSPSLSLLSYENVPVVQISNQPATTTTTTKPTTTTTKPTTTTRKKEKKKRKKKKRKRKEKGNVNEIYILYTQTRTVLPIVLYYSSLVSLTALMFTAAHRGAVKRKHSV